MSIHLKTSDGIKYTKGPFLKTSNDWKRIYQTYIKTADGWNKLYQYFYEVGAWGSCSAACGDGTKYRTVKCFRSHISSKTIDKQQMPDTSFCERYLNLSYAPSTSCNDRPCTKGIKIYTHYDDQHTLAYLNSSNQLVTVFKNNSGYKHNNKYHYDGTLTFNWGDFPIRFIFRGSNYSNKGGPRGTTFQVEGGTVNQLLPYQPNWGTADICCYFTINFDGTMTKIGGWGNCANGNGFPTMDNDPWTNTYHLSLW